MRRTLGRITTTTTTATTTTTCGERRRRLPRLLVARRRIHLRLAQRPGAPGVLEALVRVGRRQPLVGAGGSVFHHHVVRGSPGVGVLPRGRSMRPVDQERRGGQRQGVVGRDQRRQVLVSVMLVVQRVVNIRRRKWNEGRVLSRGVVETGSAFSVGRDDVIVGALHQRYQLLVSDRRLQLRQLFLVLQVYRFYVHVFAFHPVMMKLRQFVHLRGDLHRGLSDLEHFRILLLGLLTNQKLSLDME